MAKTYTLQGTVNAGFSARWTDDDWREYTTANSLSGDDNKRRIIGKYSSNYRAVNITFDSTQLAALRNKTVTSVSLTVKLLIGEVEANSNLYKIGFKKNATASSSSTSADAYARESGSTTNGYVHKASSKMTAGNTYTITSADGLSQSVPSYGYAIGVSQSADAYIILDTTATLTVVTNENDYSYTLAYNANGGSGAPSNQTGTSVGTSPSYTFTVSSTVPTRTGYNFLGWSESSTATSASYVGGNSITVTSAGTTTLYAVWKIKTYTVTYNKGSNGTGTNVTDTKTYGVALTLKGAIFTRTGYTQTGWATSDGGGKTYDLSASYTTDASVTLYPYWTPNTYTITYNKGSYGTGSQVTDTKTYGVALTLRGDTFTRSNYTQDGWSVNSNGSTKDYNLSGSYTNNAAVTLYPHWKADTYAVNFNANGGTGAPAAQTKTYGVNLTLSSTVPTRTNYIFLGWATSATGAVAYQPGGSYTANAEVILYAIWQAAKSTLSTITSSVNIGSSGTASWNIVNSAYTFKLVITYSNAPAVTVNVAANTSSTSFTIPTTWYAYLPNVTSATATATLTTYSGSTSLGSTSKTFTVAVASSVKPTISSFTHSPYAQNSTVNGWGVYVQGYSQVDLSVSASAGTGASITAIAFSGTGVSQSGTATTARSSVLSNTGYLDYSVTVTDSRGRSATSSLSGTGRPYFYEYSNPVVTSMTAFRSNSSGVEDAISGTYIRASASFTFSSCGNKNSLSVKKIEYKLHTASSWTSGVATATSGTAYTIGGGNIAITSSYDVRCTVTDALSHTTTYVVLVPPIVGFSVGLNNDRARFGGPVEKAGLQIDWDAEFNGVLDVTPRRCYARPSSAGWHRVLTITNIGQAGTSWTIDLNITRAYNNTNNEAHSIKLLGVYNSFLFADEVSKSNVIGVDKIRYTRNGDAGYVDIHYSLNVGNDVAVDFDVHAPYDAQRYFTARSLEVVADAPSGETVLTEYSFAKYTEGDVSSSFSSSKGGFTAYRCGKMVTVTFMGDSTTWTADEVFGTIGSGVIPALSYIDVVGYIGRQAVVVRLNQSGSITLWIGSTLTGNQRLYFSCTYPIL